MAGNKKTYLDWSTASIFGVDCLALASSVKIDASNKTAEGKGAGDTDAWPVLTGRETTITLELMVPNPGTAVFMGTALGTNPAGVFSINTGGGSVSGTAVLTACSHGVERDGIQTQSITLMTRGSVTFS